MNNLGYGVVSLYHALIDDILPEHFPDSYFVANNILNFPVHQDIEEEDIIQMIDELKNLLKNSKKRE
jgi:dTDP-4-amino-4,6-dideoxygalactose transaminase